MTQEKDYMTRLDSEDKHNWLNITAVSNKKVQLPCFVEMNRKFIWMHSGRNEVISIGTNVLNNNKQRFSIDSKCYDSHSNRKSAEEFLFEYSKFKEKSNAAGCWMNLIIESINSRDEGLYICQINTMSSAKVYLNILGKFERIFLKTL